ncbi:transcription factor 25 [Metarhizium rileyi]|uniref:Transcription factor 25 n=1 Tax=Metarhizium rileyi (strain RCEF 4871) TaxID=1649241 RepID=A0A162JM09_METRR|nr:transcription factor 25 [Metarhizium rileyi RCEF 4871]
MSSRQLRKLQQQKDLERVQISAPDDPEESQDTQGPIEAALKPRPNLFAALGGEEEGEEEDEDNGAPLAEPTAAAVSHSGAKKGKKKKKKSKGKRTQHAVANGRARAEAKESEDEIDRAIKELKLDSARTDIGPGSDEEDATTTGPRKRMIELLAINTYHLRVANEMRRLFGREVIESANAEEEQQSRTRRQQTPQQVDLETFLREPPGAKKLPEVSLRRNVFVQGRDHWPRQSAGGLSMEEMGKSSDGLSTEYAYVHDKNYDAEQAVFWAFVQIGDPMRMVHLLKESPYHVSTLLQVSSVAKQDQNMALAAELCERALFTFGRVTTSAFRHDIEHGRARLDFRRPENRQFWLAGFHYLRSLIRKGTFRTALEWAKLLYSLDPQDPYAMRHYIHVLALRAYQSKWWIDFMEQMALAADHPDMIYLRQSLVLARLQMNDVSGAREVLEHGIRTVPWLYCALFQELSLDTPPSIWGIGADSGSRSFWVKLYIHKAKDLWNNSQATTLLQQVARSLDKVDVASLLSQDPAVDRGATRLAYLEGQTSLLAAAPRHLLDAQPNYEFDPLPPPLEDNVFTAQSSQLPWEREGGSQEEVGQDRLPDELVVRMQNLLARRGVAPGGGMMGLMDNAGDEDEEDDEVRALRAADDEELQRDIEAHMDWGNEQGFLGTLMQMLGVGRRANDDGDDQGETGGDEEAPPPGAWPEEDAV